jgi:hypothetical protein
MQSAAAAASCSRRRNRALDNTAGARLSHDLDRGEDRHGLSPTEGDTLLVGLRDARLAVLAASR